MMTLEHGVGRLCVARFVPPFDLEQIAQFEQEGARIGRTVRRPMIICTDMRQVQVFAPAVSDRMSTMLRSNNPHIERSAILIGSSSIFGLQLERLVREAANPGRRVFRTVETVEQWLHEWLTASERAFVHDSLTHETAPLGPSPIKPPGRPH